MDELLTAATGAEEVAVLGETVGSVDLTTVSQQLETMTAWQAAEVGSQWVLIGCLIGAIVALVIGRMWR